MKYLLLFKCSMCLFLGAMLFPLFLTSCNNEEPLNSEADIIQCVLIKDSTILLWKPDTIINIGYSSIWNSIRIQVKKGSKIGLRAPKFIISQGATISPASGSEHDFSNGKEVFYTVTSQDGKWHRTYSVAYIDNITFPKINPIFEFNIYSLNQDATPSKSNRYYMIGERDSTNLIYYWASGNPGFLRARGNAKPMEYPTTPDLNGYSGACAKLTTLETGSFGSMIGMPMAAGNLFLGTFDVDLALQMKHLQATKFGTPFARIPLKMGGWYKYKAGEVLKNKAGEVLEGKDIFDIYAVLFKNTDTNGNPYKLDGTNVRDISNPQIVAIAQFPLAERKETDQWTYFEFPFEFTGREIDEKMLRNFGYDLTVVFCSSVDGANFTGAIGSTLLIDEVKITCK